MEKFEKYIENAKKARVANVPLDKTEAGKLLQKRSGTTQNIFKRIFNYFGRHYIMTITSIIALIIAGLVVSSPNPEATQDVLKNNNIELLTNEDARKHKALADNQDHSDETDPVKKEDAEYAVGDTINQITERTIDELTWDLVIFNQRDWSFQWTKLVKNKLIVTEDGKKRARKLSFRADLKDKYLIKVSENIEDSISAYIDPGKLKSLSNLDIEDYFDKLAKINRKLQSKDNSEKLIRMVNLYSHINRKFINNPSEEMKMKNKGLILSKETLEKLGIKFEEFRFLVPQYDYYPYSENRIELLSFLNYEKANELPKEDIILKKYMVFEWEKDQPKYKDNGKPNWQGSSALFIDRQSFKDLFIDVQFNGIETQYYYQIDGYSKNETNLTAPLLIEDFSTLTHHDAILRSVDNEKANKLYEMGSELHEFEITQLYNKYKKENHDKYTAKQNESDKKETIFDNMMTSFKYQKLIPVDIQIPYYGFSKEELDTMGFYSAITLWYYPNEEFLSTLPEEIRSQLEKEMKLVNAVQKGELQPEEACAEVGEKESLLGLCNLTEKAISELNIYPNPAQGMINISFELTEPRFCKIILSDFNGNYLKEISDWEERKPGTLEYHKDVSGLTPGTYMIQVITEKSEKLMFKFIKE